MVTPLPRPKPIRERPALTDTGRPPSGIAAAVSAKAPLGRVRYYETTDPEGRKLKARWLPGTTPGSLGRGMSMGELESMTPYLVDKTVDTRSWPYPTAEIQAMSDERLAQAMRPGLMADYSSVRNDREKMLVKELFERQQFEAAFGYENKEHLEGRRKAEHNPGLKGFTRYYINQTDDPLSRAHEMGHSIDYAISGYDEVSDDLRSVRRLVRRVSPDTDPLLVIRDLRKAVYYKRENDTYKSNPWYSSPNEQIAQAMSYYQNDPAGFKRDYPELAKFLRAYINNNPNVPKDENGVPVLQLSQNENDRSYG